MLVCSVVLRPQRATVVGDIAETAEALDDPAFGAIFATLTDDPGNALDILVAFLGQRIVEAATATDVVNAASTHPAVVIEEISAAIAAQDAGTTVVGAVARSAMIDSVFVNSSGTARQANANGIMLNL